MAGDLKRGATKASRRDDDEPNEHNPGPSKSSRKSVTPPPKRFSIKRAYPFCWVCHSDVPEPVWRCENPGCVRVYHIECCLKGMPNFPKPTFFRPRGTRDMRKVDILECPECVVADPDYPGRSPVIQNRSQEDIKKILWFVAVALRDAFVNNPYIDVLHYEESWYTHTVAKVVDIELLEYLVEIGEIKTLEGFLGELKWIEHNSVIMDGITSQETKNAKALIAVGMKEVAAAIECPDCFLAVKSNAGVGNNDKSSFLQPCNPPHILAWVKLPSYPWWPAKVKKIQDGKVSVLFFGDQTRSEVPIEKVKLYSQQGPVVKKAKEKGSRPALMKKALQEISDHIQELERTHGTVVLAQAFNVPMIEELNEEGLKVMFPNYRAN